jgi:glutathione peroxidase
MSVYDFTVTDNKGRPVSLTAYRGKALLIVNTATHCGFTPQYKGLQDLYAAYQAKGLEILDFPCNQFGGQAPGSAEEIEEFCTLKYHTTFPQFAKIEVNGPGADPLYVYLKERQGENPGSNINWNFTKFLADKEGNVVKRYEPIQTPEAIEADIRKLLEE